MSKLTSTDVLIQCSTLDSERYQEERRIRSLFADKIKTVRQAFFSQPNLTPEEVSEVISETRGIHKAYKGSKKEINAFYFKESIALGNNWWICRTSQTARYQQAYLLHLCKENLIGWLDKRHTEHRMRVMHPRYRKCPACKVKADPAHLQLVALQALRGIR
jgi:hypothetical protein